MGENSRRKRRAVPVGEQPSEVAGVKTKSKNFFKELKSDKQKVMNGGSASTLPFMYSFNVNNQKAPTEFET